MLGIFGKVRADANNHRIIDIVDVDIIPQFFGAKAVSIGSDGSAGLSGAAK
jgi:hypothetical protein